MEVAWWHWVVLGILLTLFELVIPAFFVVWFGFGAAFTGLILLVFPALPLGGQVLVWTLASLAMVWAWFRVFRKDPVRTRVGQSTGQLVGEVGLVTREVRPFQGGVIRFQKPMLGADTWNCRSEDYLKVGERARLLAVEGNIVTVCRD
ncbi:MAG: NfeD family protein [Betaproteobacteria bacterium]|nr:NfeD family protein [Betaproteobacteria bacterium]